ncbi:hypothetical protein LCM08_26460 [Salipiger pacificus]|nr:hypothetical protein [Alloyangia pacifica]
MTLPFLKYSPAHPWFYYLGGPAQMPSRILMRVKAEGVTGYLCGEIDQIDRLAEPQRTAELRTLRARVMDDLRQDISIYRCVVRELRECRRAEDPTAPKCMSADVHTSMSLKYCHLSNDFAHLVRIDGLLSRQRDLFDL